MPKASRPWTVTPHSPFQKLEDNLWLVTSNVPGTPMMRRMAIIRRSDGRLIFYQAVPLEEQALAELKAWGTPAFLIVPHDQHGMDAPAFSQKLGVKVYGPKASEAKMRAKFDLAGTLEDIPADPTVSFESMAGTKTGEPVAIVKSQDRTTLIFADAYMATPSQGLALPLRVLGFGGGPRIAPVFKLFFVADREALKSHLTRLSDLPGLAHLVPCHGLVESMHPAETLKRVAKTL
jgi:hypothetical protein